MHFELGAFLFLFCSQFFSSRSQTPSWGEGPRLCLWTSCVPSWDAPRRSQGFRWRLEALCRLPRGVSQRPLLLSETLTKPAPALRCLHCLSRSPSHTLTHSPPPHTCRPPLLAFPSTARLELKGVPSEARGLRREAPLLPPLLPTPSSRFSAASLDVERNTSQGCSGFVGVDEDAA